MFTASGSLTTKNAKSTLEAGLLAIAAGQLEFDLADLQAVDSAAVAVLLAWRRAANAQSGSLQFKNLPVNLRSLIELYGVDELLGPTFHPAPRTDISHH